MKAYDLSPWSAYRAITSLRDLKAKGITNGADVDFLLKKLASFAGDIYFYKAPILRDDKYFKALYDKAMSYSDDQLDNIGKDDY